MAVKTKKVALEPLTSGDFERKTTEPKILILDIETMSAVGEFWRAPWAASIIEILEDIYVLSWSAKWLNGKQTTRSLPDYEGYTPGSRDDRALLEELQALIERADVVVAHNGDKFDIPVVNGRCLVNGLPPTKPVRTYDTKKFAAKRLGFTSNKQDDIARLLGIPRKIPIHYETWKGCRDGDPKAWALMKRYNAHDVRMLEEIYLRFRSWDPQHPNLNAIAQGNPTACPMCGGTHFHSRGYAPTPTGRRRQYKCQNPDCGRWFGGKHEKFSDFR